MSNLETLEISIGGMDCAECTQHVRQAIATLPGVEAVDVFLATEKAIVRLDPDRVSMSAISQAVQDAGYTVRADQTSSVQRRLSVQDFSQRISILLAIVFGAVLFVVLVGEWLGLFARITEHIPAPIGWVIVLIAGYPVFLNVIRAAFKRQIISHTLMTLGVIAALVVGEWATAMVVVFFMRVGDYVERFTTDRARRAVRDLMVMAPQTARVERNGQEIELPIAQVQAGEIVIVRPGEKIPVDGQVIGGQATVNQATITGESLPVEAGAGAQVYAATMVQLGHLRIRATHVGATTTFGRIIKMVQEAEAHRADIQRLADKFSGYYLPVVTGIAALTFLTRRDPLATAAVLVVACSCSFALATPIAMLASIGAGARRGLLIKGGRYLELLACADVLLIDKTGTLTLGKPRITDVEEVDTEVGSRKLEILRLAASAERYSEHPLAEAVRAAARQQNLRLDEPHDFQAIPGKGVQARVNGHLVRVGNRHMIADRTSLPLAAQLEAQGKTLLYVECDGKLIGLLAAADTLRPDVPAALAAVRSMLQGARHIELLTGDNERAAASLAAQLGLPYRANLLPEDKIRIVREFQAQGHVVVMIGDGINDTPALVQANTGIAMGVAGSDIATEAAHIVLMREDWSLVPQLFQIAHRTMHVVKMNLAFTAIYNVVGLSLAALGFLPPVLAAAAQSLPDLGILGNSSRLLRQNQDTRPQASRR